jgi:hypothetical protein
MTVVCPKSFQKAAPSSAATAEALSEQFLGFWAAYGLALQGLDLTKVNSNLLPTEIAKQVVWRKKKPTFAAAAACLLLAGGVIWFRQWTDLGALAAASQGAPEVVIDRPLDIIENGPPPSLSPRAKAASVQKAGRMLKDELSKLGGQGEDERTETRELISLQQAKTVVPRIFQIIHESIPVPEGPLGEAMTQAEVLQAIADGGVPRGERKQVFIKSLNLQYLQDVNETFWPPCLTDIPDPINDPEGDQPGFMIVIVCTTPNQDGRNFIDQTFLKSLREKGQRPNAGFYFDRVCLIEGSRVEAEADESTGAGSRGFTGRRPEGGTGTGPGEVSPSLLDPVTNEPFSEDWQFKIWVDVILEDYPEPDSDEEVSEEGD